MKLKIETLKPEYRSYFIDILENLPELDPTPENLIPIVEESIENLTELYLAETDETYKSTWAMFIAESLSFLEYMNWLI